jgi:starch phosphorylase
MFNCDETAAYAAASLAFRDRLITEWNRTQQRQTFADGKRVYYLSLEFLMGRALDNAMLNVGLKNVAQRTVSSLDWSQSVLTFHTRGPYRSRFPH